jgi:myosin heavy subunit
MSTQNQEVSISLSNETILILCSIGFASLGIVMFFILRSTPSNVDRNGEEEATGRDYGEFLEETDAATLTRAERRARAKLRMKKARRAPAAQAAGQDADGAAVPEEQAAQIEDARSRKERIKAAKALEKEERKMTAEMARVRREADLKTRPKKQTIQQDDNSIRLQLRIEDVFHQREGADPMDEILFWHPLTSKYKDNPQRFLDDSVHLKKMTIGTFIHKLQTNGSVSIASLADKYGIPMDQVISELERLNKLHGIIGIVDKNGDFVYVSREMIEEAVEMGKKMGRIPYPKDEFVVGQ